MPKLSSLLALLAVVFAASVASAQQPPTVRIRGVIEAVNGPMLSIKSRDGTDMNVHVTDNVAVFGVFRGTHTGAGGPVPATGKSAAADYVYVMDFDGDKIRHLTKIWNDVATLRQLGWA